MITEITNSAFSQKYLHDKQKLAIRALSDHTNRPKRQGNNGAEDSGDAKMEHVLF